jgi:hypothetical protein
MMVELVNAGLATATAERAVAGRHPIVVTRSALPRRGGGRSQAGRRV